MTSNTSEKRRPAIDHFAFSENSQLTIFTTKYGGDPFDDVPLLCTLCALSMIFEISSLQVSGKTLDT